MTQLEQRRRRGLSSLRRAELRRELEGELRRLWPGGEGFDDAGDLDRVSSAPPGRPRQILAALRRVARPEFGLCHVCRRAISYQRLSVLPETTLCVRCSRHREGRVGP